MRRMISRLGFYVVALWASVTLNFIIPRLMPGSPIEAYLVKMQGQNVSLHTIDALRAQFGLSNAPIFVQYLQYLGNLLHGDLGISISNYPYSVWEVLSSHIPWTIGLVGISVVLSFAIGTLIGIVIAWRRGGALDSTVPPILTFISSIPYFWMALALLYFCGFLHSWFPISGGYDINNVDPGFSFDFLMSALHYGTLPAVTIILGSLSGWVLVMRNTMVTTLSEDYVLMAQAKGLSYRRVIMTYAARNAILPSITSFSISLAQVVGGSLLTEMVFNYPGIGYVFYNAVNNLDYSLVEGCFLIIALAVLAANLIADVVYNLLDPRVRQGEA
ncbi:ABC transporter permease [Dictyobacter arantiisoli]|uniref:Peptide ABC transporter permease n=1 Tax=Dictyobacter arantiisoli TaxID=2014874 RepID=A0A5A5TAD7_9CHLR|nr:ABC transporter permease [Dictyobacter arantiisoli]GCF08451.1 peptide ABC transporter permease [Dictyobacter arantiisoli]